MKNILYILFLFCIRANATTYYVATTGNNGNAGTLASPWATLAYAAGNSSSVAAGDVVYVKAGSYTGTVTFQKSGTYTSPISYIGYTTMPGDQPTILINNSNPYAAYTSSVMPTYTGTSRSTGTCFNMEDAEYITCRNFQITNYSTGVFIGGASIKRGVGLFNVNCMTLGNITTSDYDGYGIRLGVLSTKFANNICIGYCLVVNAAAEGITVCGDYNIINRCKIFSNSTNDTIGSDYYLTIFGSYNLVKGCYIKQNAGQPYGTHGYTIKSNAEQVIDHGDPYNPIKPMYNKFIEDTVVNIGEGFAFRHRWVTNNLVYHCRATGTHTPSASDSDGNGAVFRDGASWNIVDGMTGDSLYNAIKFIDTVEDGDTGGSPTGHPGNNNKVINSTFANCFIGVYFDDSGIASDAGDNLISNCTFWLTRYTFESARRCTLMRYEACVFFGNSDIGSGGAFRENTYATDVASSQFRYCTFYKQTGGMPGGFVAGTTGGLTSDPLLSNPSSRNFHLQSGSPCRDAVTTYIAETGPSISTSQFSNPYINNLIWLNNNKRHLRTPPNNPTRDYDGYIQPKGTYPDIGAFEY